MPILAGSGHRPPAGIAKLKHERIGIGKKRSRSQSEAEAPAPALPAAGVHQSAARPKPGMAAFGESFRRRGHAGASVTDPSRKPIVHRSRPTISAGAFLGAAMSDRPHAAPSPWQGTWGMASSAARSSR
jgi:hypothetical protein